MHLHSLPVTIAKRHMKLHRNVMPFIAEAIELANAQTLTVRQNGCVSVTVDFGRLIGFSECVPVVCDDDNVVYAIRQGRDRHMRFVKNRPTPAVSRLTMIFFQIPGGWRLVSAWFGDQAAREPQDPGCTAAERVAAYEFWNAHALVWGTQPVREHTITDTRPWPQL